MALDQITSQSIAAGAITVEDISNGSITAAKLHDTAIADKLGYTPANETTVNAQITNALVDPVFTGDSITIPAGSTAERPVSPTNGMLRFNTTFGKLEQYDGNDWAAIDSPPVILSITPSTELGNDDPQVIVISGSNFSSSLTVKLIGNNLTEYTPTTVTRNSSSQITITFAGNDRIYGINEPYDVKVTNSSGLSALLENALNINDVPTWSTASGSLGTVIEDVAMSNITLSATDPESVGLTYTIASGALPSGVSLSSGGVISGTPNVNDSYNSSGVTHNFSVGASDGAQTTTRAFSILRKWLDGTSSTLAAPSAAAIKSLTGTTTDGLYWINLPTVGPTQVYCDMNTNGGGWIHVGTISDNNEARGYVTGTSQQSGGSHPWAAPLFASQNSGIWENTTTLGTQSFTSDFKSSAWVYYPMTQLLMKDQGETLRNLFFTNSSQISSQSLSTWFSTLQWKANGSETSSTAYSNGRVTGLNITNFGVVDPVLESGNKSVMLFKFGEADGVQDGNKDRSMIASHYWNGGQVVDGPSGLGCFRSADPSQSGWYQTYRDVVPVSSGYPDEPPNTISGSPYNYTMWVR